jgi:hypothetical protein
MRGLEPKRLERLVNELAPLFYAFMGAALLAILVGATGPGAWLLILGSCVQVVRAACEELAVRQRQRARRSRPTVVRSTQSRALARSRKAQRAARPVAVSASRR